VRAECENQRANYLDYVDTLIESRHFKMDMFGSWKNRVKKYKEYKELQRLDRRSRIDRSKLPTLDEDSYVDPTDEEVIITREHTRDRSTDASFESANDETLTEIETEQNTPSSKTFKAKVSSFERNN